jgi:hypothetical protein
VTALTREQVLAFRLGRHHLAERLPAGAAERAAWVGLQDTPPGGAGLALAARVEGAGPHDLARLVVAPSVRGAPLAVALADLAVFTTALAPPDDAAAAAFMGSAAETLDGIRPLDALHRVGAAVADALAGGPLGRDDLHQALRERLPAELLWWCRGCGSHHVHPSLWRATGVLGVLAIVGRQGRTAVFGAPPAAPAVPDATGELARRYLRAYGPAAPADLAAWAGVGREHAALIWDRAGDLAAVGPGRRRRWLLAEDAGARAAAAPVLGVRLLPGYDPYLAQRDRDLAVPDAALRKRLWSGMGNPGALLADGEIAGTWRAQRRGRRLVVTVDAPAEVLRGRDDALAAEAAALAPWRGAETAEVARAG